LKVFIPEVEDSKPLDSLYEVADVKVGVQGRFYSEADLAREMADIDVAIITSQQRITKRVIEKGAKLRGIVKCGSRPGSENVDMDAANERKILVAYTPGANTDSVAEFTVALILALAKRLPDVMWRIGRRQWRDPSCLGVELSQKTAGIVGLGAIGFKVSQIVSHLGMSVVAYDPYVSSEKADSIQARMADLKTLLHESDVVSLHAQLTKENVHMIRSSQLGLMKRTAFLINSARGALVDQRALYESLRDRRIAGAALDAFETEPPPSGSPLFELDNVIMTPHIASWTADALRKETSMAVDEARRILAGERPSNLANPEVLR
jgi:D-3-phosphoglycerate dehydrogenase